MVEPTVPAGLPRPGLGPGGLGPAGLAQPGLGPGGLGPAGLKQRRFLAIVMLCGVGLGMTAPITVLFATSFGASPGLAGLVWSSMAISLLAVDVFLGTAFVPRLDGRFLLWVAVTIYGVGALVSAAAPSLVVMVAGRVVQGIGAAVFMSGGLQLAVRFAPAGGEGKAIGAFNAACFTGIACGPLLGGGLASIGSGQFGFRFAFAVSGVVCFAVALTTRLALPAIPSHQTPSVRLPGRPQARSGLRLWPPIVLGLFGEALRGGVEFTVVPLFGHDHVGLGTSAIGVGLSCLAVMDILTMRYSGMLADRIGCRPILLGALVIGAGACAGAPLVSGLAGFIVWCAALGVAVGASWVTPAAMVVDVSTDSEPALAAYRIAADVGEAVGSTATGGLVGALGPVGGVVAIAGVFVALAGWVARLPEAGVRKREIRRR
jgi:predicted MFS family arabinose efflux permease